MDTDTAGRAEAPHTVEPVIVRIWPVDLVEGVRHCAGLCPIARSFKRRFPDATHVLVAPDYVETDLGDGWLTQTFRLTPAARAWIKAFDAGKRVTAGNLHLFDL